MSKLLGRRKKRHQRAYAKCKFCLFSVFYVSDPVPNGNGKYRLGSRLVYVFLSNNKVSTYFFLNVSHKNKNNL